MPLAVELPLLKVEDEPESRGEKHALPVLTLSGGCGSGCSSCGDVPAETRAAAPAEEPKFQMPFATRRLALDAVPSEGSWIRNIDLDLTVECNLRCTYCFKE